MKVLTVLKYLINFVFISFLVCACLILITPFYDPSLTEFFTADTMWMYLFFPIIHLTAIFMILFYLRKFVHHSTVGTPLDESSRKYLKRAGIFCLIFGFLKMPQLFGLITFYSAVGIDGWNDAFSATSNFLQFGSLFYSMLIGLFFIYLSKVLESSYLIKQENQLTI